MLYMPEHQLDAVPVAELERPAEAAFRQGLAAVDLRQYSEQAEQWCQQVAMFADELDGRTARDVEGSPRRVMPALPGDERQMEYYGTQFAQMLVPLTGVHVSWLIRGRFLVYDEAGAQTTNNIDDPLDDDHALSIGVDLVGNGILRATTYGKIGQFGSVERVPILLTPGDAVAQRGQSQVFHEVVSLEPRRIVGIWDFASV